MVNGRGVGSVLKADFTSWGGIAGGNDSSRSHGGRFGGAAADSVPAGALLPANFRSEEVGRVALPLGCLRGIHKQAGAGPSDTPKGNSDSHPIDFIFFVASGLEVSQLRYGKTAMVVSKNDIA